MQEGYKKLRKILLLLLVAFSFHLDGFSSRDAPVTLIRGKKIFGLKGLYVDVHVHFDIEGFKAPDMQAKLYSRLLTK